MSLTGKKIILAVCGSIAAYKSAIITRLLIKSGAEVQVLMTDSAIGFITPLTLSTLSKRNVYQSVHNSDNWNNHVELGLWADAMIVAPATATTLSKMANGICDNIVTAVYLSARCPVFVAPAMDLDMWQHPATKKNIEILRTYGNQLIPVVHGELASGLIGEGRMAEPEAILAFLEKYFQQKNDFIGINMLITAGPTYEALDPVRFIGNRSSGKMGIALAEAAANRGAKVTLILGPSRLKPVHKNIHLTSVQSAQEMMEAAQKYYQSANVTIFSAAVADYRPKIISNEKIKKKDAVLHIELEKTPDIAANLGAMKQLGQLNVGFALETNDEFENAKSKLHKKNFDFVVLNSLQDSGAGFNHDTNKISIFRKDETVIHFTLKTKEDVATDILDEVVRQLHQLDNTINK